MNACIAEGVEIMVQKNFKRYKMKYYKCDGCSEAETAGLTYWLTIGTADGENKLFIENNTGFHGLMEARTHHDMHFCGAKCFIKYLFGDGLEVTAKDSVA